uniref:Uncharacterized protein n=2 Tax=Oncorhynchus TaxID=8016 RepID=A0A8C7HGQ7_ONCKI
TPKIIWLKVSDAMETHDASCPGVHLPAKDDIYLSGCFMGQYHKLEFEKVDQCDTSPDYSKPRVANQLFWRAISGEGLGLL